MPPYAVDVNYVVDKKSFIGGIGVGIWYSVPIGIDPESTKKKGRSQKHVTGEHSGGERDLTAWNATQQSSQPVLFRYAALEC